MSSLANRNHWSIKIIIGSELVRYKHDLLETDKPCELPQMSMTHLSFFFPSCYPGKTYRSVVRNCQLNNNTFFYGGHR